ncbi:MAG: toxic anion resistance protein [Methylococcaceae bacterium]
MSDRNYPDTRTKTCQLDLPGQKLASNKSFVSAICEPPDQIRLAVDQFLTIDSCDFKAQRIAVATVENIGTEIGSMIGRRSAIWDQLIQSLTRNGANEAPMVKELRELKSNAEMLTDQTSNLIRCGQAHSTLLKTIARLELYKNQLRRDNITLEDEQQLMRELSLQQNKVLAFAEAIANGLKLGLAEWQANKDPTIDAKRDFIENELLYILHQRIVDLQQQSTITWQGILNLERIRRDNQEMLRGISRLLNVMLSVSRMATVM